MSQPGFEVVPGAVDVHGYLVGEAAEAVDRVRQALTDDADLGGADFGPDSGLVAPYTDCHVAAGIALDAVRATLEVDADALRRVASLYLDVEDENRRGFDG